MRATPLLLLPPLLALSGCLAPNGEFQNGHFSYECTGKTDAACSWIGTQGRVTPPPVALGAPFILEYDDTTGGLGVVSLEPASLEVMTFAGGVFTVHVPGPATVLARGAAGNIVDMIHVDAQPVADLLVFPMHRPRRVGSPGAPQLIPPDDGQPVPAVVLVACGDCSVKTQASLFAAPTGVGGEVLGGALDYSWSVVPEGVVRIAGSATGSTATIEAVATGSAVVRIDVGGFVKELPVRVEE